jgi:hypothetical protein
VTPRRRNASRPRPSGRCTRATRSSASRGRNRGTPDAILSAAEDTLIGTRNARLIERVGGNAYRLALVTRPSETPDPDLTLRMATTQVAGGSKLTHTLTEGVTIDEDTGTIDTPGSGTIDTPI